MNIDIERFLGQYGMRSARAARVAISLHTDFAPPCVRITPGAKRALDLYVQGCKYEISGLGRVRKEGSNLTVTDITLFSQKVTHSETRLSTDAIHDFDEKIMRAGGNPGEWRMWWHSHADMGVFWSAVDTKTMRDFFGEKTHWMLFIESNHAGDYLCRADVQIPFGVTYDRLPLSVIDEEAGAEDDQINFPDRIVREIREKVVVDTDRMSRTIPEVAGWDDPVRYEAFPHIRQVQKEGSISHEKE